MKILVIGSGGREHALVWRLKESNAANEIYCAPGNAGIGEIAVCVPVAANDLAGIVDFARGKNFDLAVVGPEEPLCLGLADQLRALGIPVFGPGKIAAQLEGSKDFAKRFMIKYGIPTARGNAFDNEAEALDYLKKEFANGAEGIVVKADGLAAGKGVLVSTDEAEAAEFLHGCFAGTFGKAGARVVLEELLTGEETSVLALTDGKTIKVLASSQDHKRVFDQDKGPNTGGMGAYSPAPVVTSEVSKRIENEILQPFLKGLAAEKLDFRGVLFAGLMIKNGVPKVLEFNVRFGDPEIQPVLRRFQGDFADTLLKTANGKLNEASWSWDERAAVSVIIASGGYPGKYAKGYPISGLKEAADTGCVVFHAGTALNDKKEITNAGGRVLGVTALGNGIKEAIDLAYQGVDKIRFTGCFCRRDIGYRALERLKK